MTGRAVKEWVGKTPDTKIPPRVELRVLEAYAHRCYLTHVEIREGDHWQTEHRIALCNGGKNRESNLAPVLVEPHKIKTRADMRIKKKGYRVRKKRFGLAKPKWRPMAGTRASGIRKRMSGRVERWA